MLPAAPYLIPVSVSVLYLLYKYLRSGERTELSEVLSVSRNSGASNGVPLHRNNDPQIGLPLPLPDTHPELSDPDPAILDEIRKLVRKLDPADLDKIRKFHPDFLDKIGKLDPAFLIEIRKLDPAVLDLVWKLCLEEKKEGGEEAERSCNVRETETEDKSENVNEKQSEESDGGGENKNENGGEVKKKVIDEGSNRKCEYPVRPAAGDCAYYLRTGNCKFGSNCKFNHPQRTKKNQVSKDKKKESDKSTEKPGQTDRKNFTSGGSNNGKARSFNNNRGGPSVASTQKLNFLGLPIRPGKKECSYYMRNASCFHGTRCCFTHPNPTGEPELPSGGNDGPPSSEGALSQMAAPWPSPSSLNDTPPSQGIYSQNTGWNSYQAPAYLPEGNMPTRPPFVFNSLTETNIYNQHPQQQQVEQFPERPDQPVRSNFLRTGDCMYKFHPKTQTAVPPACTLSDKGLPLRPGQNICTQYSHYGLCNSGAACPFDHPSLSTSFL